MNLLENKLYFESGIRTEIVADDNLFKTKDVDFININDSDGKLHLYTCVAFNGKRWGLQVILDTEQITKYNIDRQCKMLIDSVIRTLEKEEII